MSAIAAVVSAPKVLASMLVILPLAVMVSSAPELTVTAAPLETVTSVIEPAFVVDARLASLIVTAPFTTPFTAAAAVAAAS